MRWQDRFEVRQKSGYYPGKGTYYLVDKLDDRFVKSFRFYRTLASARAAASHIFRAEQKRIEKLLLGQ